MQSVSRKRQSGILILNVLWNRKIWCGILRSDYRGSVGFLSTSQFISIGIVAAGIILYQMLPRIYEDAKKAE